MKKILFLIFILFCQCTLAENIVILHTSDIHGRLIPIEYKNQKDLGGFSRRVSFFNQIRQENKNVLIFDSGDYYQGSLFYSFDKGLSGSKLMPYAGYDAITLGNHEFDDGIKILKRNLKTNTTPVICANVEFNDKYLKTRVKPYILKEIDGKKILITGVVTPDLKSLSNTQGVIIKNPAFVINNIINSHTADKIIVISHCGKNYDEEILEVNPEINLILGGHNHLLLKKDNKIFQNGEFGVFVGVFNFDTDKGLTDFYRKLIDNSIKENELVNKKLRKHIKQVSNAQINILGYTDEKLLGEQDFLQSNQTNLGYFILKSMVNEFNNNYDVALIQSGSIRLNRNITDKIIYSDVLELLPFNDKIVCGKIQGKYLKNIFNCGNTEGRCYLQKLILPENIEDDEIYTVVTTNYLANGGDNFKDFEYLREKKYSKKNIRNIFIKYVKNNSPLNKNFL